jgi:hypothetical protein
VTVARLPTSVADFARAAGASITEIPRKEGSALLQAWREVYCAPLHEATGKWSAANGSSWETFSGGFFPSVGRHRALRDYSEQSADDLLALPENDHDLAIRCTSSLPIDFSPLRQDIYVAPSSLAWTMAFTHEDPIYGPYFARIVARR